LFRRFSKTWQKLGKNLVKTLEKMRRFFLTTFEPRRGHKSIWATVAGWDQGIPKHQTGTHILNCLALLQEQP
jgi:hypothetical protein